MFGSHDLARYSFGHNKMSYHGIRDKILNTVAGIMTLQSIITVSVENSLKVGLQIQLSKG